MKIGETLDTLGVKTILEDGDMITDALVIMKVVEADGNVRLSMAWTEGMSWLERLGMVSAANSLEAPNPHNACRHHDD